ncbi:class II aldolase [Phreatobacter stygius]|uniref:Class II aldolase n=2 Tax=Phreatobacter stygius TaxID=1940610 RepID=A0A4D7B9Q8_9HYPH|nr:class II aldolase [Phreatobacter stygius]
MTDETGLRAELIETCRKMNRLGINKGTSGNVSVRHGEGFLISPTGVDYDALRPELIVQVRFDGSFDGDVLPSSEWRLHRDILRERDDLGAIVHTHSTHATALAIMGLDIPAIHYSIAAAGGPDIRCAAYATFGTQELADAVLAALRDRRACLLAHHGVVAAHVSMAKALSLAVTVEELAKQYILCRGMGVPPALAEAEIMTVVGKYQSYGQQPARLHS